MNSADPLAIARRGHAFEMKGDHEKAISDYTEAIRLDPTNALLRYERGLVYDYAAKWKSAAADFLEAIRLDPKYSDACNSLAWLRATCPDSALRNGTEAVNLATRACQLSNWEEWSYVDSLAAAHAEAGDFEMSIKYQKQAMSMKEAPDSERKEMQQRLELFQTKQPYRGCYESFCKLFLKRVKRPKFRGGAFSLTS